METNIRIYLGSSHFQSFLEMTIGELERDATTRGYGKEIEIELRHYLISLYINASSFVPTGSQG